MHQCGGVGDWLWMLSEEVEVEVGGKSIGERWLDRT